MGREGEGERGRGGRRDELGPLVDQCLDRDIKSLGGGGGGEGEKGGGDLWVWGDMKWVHLPISTRVRVLGR